MTQTATIDINDVPAVSGEDLERVMRHLIITGRGLALVKGLTDAEWLEVDGLIWSHDWSAARRMAVAMRFRSLVAAFAARRLKDLLMQRGFAVLSAAMHVAAGQRLNARFGFSAQKMLAGLNAAMIAEPLAGVAPQRTPMAAAA